MSTSCSQCDDVTPPDNSVEGDSYATIQQDQSCVPESSDLVSTCEEEECSNYQVSTTTEGSTQPWMTDAREATKLTLLGRIGNRLAKFVGSGFIQVEGGEARLVSHIPLKIRDLYHRYVIPAPGQHPVIGAAKPAPYMVVSDDTGKAWGIKGLSGEDCFVVWDFVSQKWGVKPLTDFPITMRGTLPKSTGVELVGFDIPDSDCIESARQLRALSGSGVVMLSSKIQKIEDGCACDPCNVTSEATVVRFPDDSSSAEYMLEWTFEHGLRFLPKDYIRGEKGDTGATGAAGSNGAKGDTGDAGATGGVGLTGAAGAAGAPGSAGDAADLVVSTDTATLELTSVVVAPLTGGQNINAVDTDINLATATTIDAPVWSHIAGTANFTLGADNVSRVEIVASVHFKNSDVGDAANPNVAPVLELWKNGTTLLATSASGLILNEITENHSESSNLVSYTDTSGTVSGASYKIVCRRGSDQDAPMIGISGYFSAKALTPVEVVTGVSISNAP